MRLLLFGAVLAASILPGPAGACEPVIGAWAAYGGSLGGSYSVWEVWPDGTAQHFDKWGCGCYRWERTGITQQGRDLYLFVEVCGSPDNPLPGTSSLYYFDEDAAMLVCADTGERFY